MKQSIFQLYFVQTYIYLQIYYIIPFESFVSTFKFTGMIFSYKHNKETNIFLNHRLVLP